MRYSEETRVIGRRARRALRLATLPVCLATLLSREASGQQDCRTPTPSAETSALVFLISPNNAQWRESLGITATTVAELTPLTDAADAALCRRMDSTFAPLRGWYFRTGRYIIGTDYGSPPPRRSEFAPIAFVFDSLGQRLTRTASALAPADVKFVLARAGQVQLGWSNRTADIDSYQLQRAVGSGAFADIGGSLVGSATSATDATASNGNTYRYRLVAFRAGLLSEYSNPVSATLSDPGTLSRSATGLLYRDQFDRANGSPGADWVAESGNWQIVGNAIQIDVYYDNPILRLAALPTRKDFHVQWLSRRSNIANYASMYARRSGATLYLADLGSTSDGGKANAPRMFRQTAGNYVGLGFGSFASVANTQYRLSFSVIGTERRFWANGVQEVMATDTTSANDINGTLALNAYGSGGSGTVRVDDLIVCSNRVVTIAGLPAGYRMRVAGILSARATTSGVVSLDLLGTALPVAQIELINPSNVPVRTYAPSDGVWGGDRYSLNGVP